VVSNALKTNFSDLEDAVQYETAIAHQMEAIGTRNPQDFPENALQILTHEALLQQLSQAADQSS
jgi:hypothetical protein